MVDARPTTSLGAGSCDALPQRRPSRAEALARALELVVSHNASVGDAALECGVPPEELHRTVNNVKNGLPQKRQGRPGVVTPTNVQALFDRVMMRVQHNEPLSIALLFNDMNEVTQSPTRLRAQTFKRFRRALRDKGLCIATLVRNSKRNLKKKSRTSRRGSASGQEEDEEKEVMAGNEEAEKKGVAASRAVTGAAGSGWATQTRRRGTQEREQVPILTQMGDEKGGEIVDVESLSEMGLLEWDHALHACFSLEQLGDSSDSSDSDYSLFNEIVSDMLISQVPGMLSSEPAPEQPLLEDCLALLNAFSDEQGLAGTYLNFTSPVPLHPQAAAASPSYDLPMLSLASQNLMFTTKNFGAAAELSMPSTLPSSSVSSSSVSYSTHQHQLASRPTSSAAATSNGQDGDSEIPLLLQDCDFTSQFPL